MRVEIDADRLIRGTLRVVGDISVSRAIEVPGGSVKEYLLQVPVPATGSLDVVVATEDAPRLAVALARVRAPSDQELVGLLPELLGSRPLPGTAPLTVDVGTARFVELRPDLLPVPDGLRSLGTIGVAPEDLSRLSRDQRSGLLRWVADGGRLLVDAAPGTVLPGLPRDWTPGGSGRVRAGMGEVVATDGAMRAGRWSGLVEPTGRGQEAPDPTLLSSVFTAGGPLADLEVGAPTVSSLFPLLALYAIAAGPVLYFVLKRRRREVWTWAVVPALAFLLSVGSVVGALASRGDPMAAHMTILAGDESGMWARTEVATILPGGGVAEVGFPEGWGMRGAAFGEQQIEPEARGFELTSGGITGRMPLNPDQFGIMGAAGPVEAGEGLIVSASGEGKRIRGTVRNATPFTLQQVHVLVAKNSVELGGLAPGEQRSWKLATKPSRPHFAVPAQELWPDATLHSPGDPDGPVLHDLWRLAGQAFGPDFLAPGDAVAVGWTRDYRPELEVLGAPTRPEGRTLVVGRAAVRYGSGRVRGLAAHRSQVRGPTPTDVEPGWDQLFTNDPLVLRFDLPPGADPDADLALRGPEGLDRVEVWTGDRWKTVHEAQRSTGATPPGGFAQPQPYVQVQPPLPQQFHQVPPSVRGRILAQRFQGPEVAMADYELGVTGRTVYVRITQPDTPALHSAWAFTLAEKP